MRERLEFAVDRRWGARERHQEVARFCRSFGDGAAGDLQLTGLAFAISAVNLCVLVKAVFIVSCSLKEC